MAKPVVIGEALSSGASPAAHGSFLTLRWRERVSCELVSEIPNSLLGKYREFRRFGAWRRLGGTEKGHEISVLRANSLRIPTGNLLQPCRELNRAIREVSAVIRESAFVRYLAFAPGDKSDRPDRSRTLPRRRKRALRDARSRPKPISSSRSALSM